MPKNDLVDPVKETCRLIRLARSYWDAHRNLACRTHRDMAQVLDLAAEIGVLLSNT
jgi:hypothetical protein